jgi:hypothetical protein
MLSGSSRHDAQKGDRRPKDRKIYGRAKITVIALSRPKRHNDGKSEKIVTTKLHANTTDVRIGRPGR